MSYGTRYLCTITIAMCSGPNRLNPIPPPMEQKLGRGDQRVKLLGRNRFGVPRRSVFDPQQGQSDAVFVTNCIFSR